MKKYRSPLIEVFAAPDVVTTSETLVDTETKQDPYTGTDTMPLSSTDSELFNIKM